jgi:hypothetical protein
VRDRGMSFTRADPPSRFHLVHYSPLRPTAAIHEFC